MPPHTMSYTGHGPAFQESAKSSDRNTPARMSAHATPRCPGCRYSVSLVKTKVSEVTTFTMASAGLWVHSGPWTAAEQQPKTSRTAVAACRERRPRHGSHALHGWACP